jgi:hypothetical protein
MTVNPISSGWTNYQNAASAQQTANNRTTEETGLSLRATGEAERTAGIELLEIIDADALQDNEEAALYQANGAATQQLAAAMTGVGGTFDAFA